MPRRGAAAHVQLMDDTASFRQRARLGPKRYVETTALSALLHHDPALGGTPVRLLRARWLLERLRRPLGYRQLLERDHPEAFASEEITQRLVPTCGASTVSATP